MKKKYTAQSLSALLALATLLLMASCQGNTAEPELEQPTNPALPGNASPNGGNEPGVEFALTTPVISIGGATATTRNAVSLKGVSEIDLYADLQKRDGTVTQSCHYKYTDTDTTDDELGTWEVVTKMADDATSPAPLYVNGGSGNYHMRAAARVTDNGGRRNFSVFYNGIAIVAADQMTSGATFTFAKNMTPTTAAIEVNLVDAMSADEYSVYLRGMTTTKFSSPVDSPDAVIWTSTGSICPVRSLNGTTYVEATDQGQTETAVYAAFNVLPGSVPGCWNTQETEGNAAYTRYTAGANYDGFLGNTDGANRLFTIYEKATPGTTLTVDASTGLPSDPTQIAKTYHVIAPAGGYVIDFGKLYRFNISTGGKSAKIVNIDVSDFVPSTGADIDINNRPQPTNP